MFICHNKSIQAVKKVRKKLNAVILHFDHYCYYLPSYYHYKYETTTITLRVLSVSKHFIYSYRITNAVDLKYHLQKVFTVIPCALELNKHVPVLFRSKFIRLVEESCEKS